MRYLDSPWTNNGQPRLGQVSIGQDSLSKDNIDKESIDIDKSVATEKTLNSTIMTEQQLLQAVYIDKIKDRNANNIIECVSYLKVLSIEIIKCALEKASSQKIPEWKYAKEILEYWIKNDVRNISDIQNINDPYEILEAEKVTKKVSNGGFKRKGDEILDGK